jgi:hypothetical protein
MIQTGDATAAATHMEVFSEDLYPLTKTKSKAVPPQESTLFSFVSRIFSAAQLSAESAVVTLIYVKRLQTYSGLTLDTSNWRRVLLACILLASKVWEDTSVWNVDMCSLFPAVNVKNINWLERELLDLINFDVTVSASEYAAEYFLLRNRSEDLRRPFHLAPISTTQARTLEDRSAAHESKVKPVKKVPKGAVHISHTSEELVYHPKQVPASIENISSLHHDALGRNQSAHAPGLSKQGSASAHATPSM